MKTIIQTEYEKGYEDALLGRQNRYESPTRIIKRRIKIEHEKVICKDERCHFFFRNKNTGAEYGHLIGCEYDIINNK